jgi:sugar phosphate isomerase/epimerase
MIFISSAYSSEKKIRHSIEELSSHGFNNIELTGGTRYYRDIKNDLFELKKSHDLNFLIHNYFPPPREDFVLNLASLNESISRKSIEQCKKSIDLSRILDANKVSFHAGFMIDIPVNEIGKEIHKTNLFEKEKALSKLYENCEELLDYANGDMEIYLENNVYSLINSQNFGRDCPVFLINCEDFIEIRKNVNVKLLLDVAHLNVSSKTLGFPFGPELEKMLSISDYIHISDNDGLTDQNLPFLPKSQMLKKLSSYALADKIITLEIYSNIERITESYKSVQRSLTL